MHAIADLVEDLKDHVQAKQHAAAHDRELHCIILCHCVLCLIARVSLVPESQTPVSSNVDDQHAGGNQIHWYRHLYGVYKKRSYCVSLPLGILLKCYSLLHSKQQLCIQLGELLISLS
jgi:hypothetical protein